MLTPRLAGCLVLAGAVFAACSSSVVPGPPPAASAAWWLPARGASAGKIRHVIIVVQENRSFDTIYGGPSPFPGATAATQGQLLFGKYVPLRPVSLAAPCDISHIWHSAVTSYDAGRMDGFGQAPWQAAGFKGVVCHRSSKKNVGPYAYAYVDRSESKPYWLMAQRYSLHDHFFPTEFGPSFTAHLNLIAATTQITPNLGPANTQAIADPPFAAPWGCDGGRTSGSYVITPASDAPYEPSPDPYPCFTEGQFRTMADTLDAAHVSWRYYAPRLHTTAGAIWSEFSAIRKVRYGPDWQNVVSRPNRVLTDLTHGNLAQVSWVIPTGPNSDHAGNGSAAGPSWVAAIINTLGKSRYWDSTAVFVTWDDWGGWYDSVAPPQLDYRGLGERVPCIVISPYVKRGFINHGVTEFGSILYFVEETFGLPSLGFSPKYTDARARVLGETFDGDFDFGSPPAAFGAPVPARYPAAYFLNQAEPAPGSPGDGPPDED